MAKKKAASKKTKTIKKSGVKMSGKNSSKKSEKNFDQQRNGETSFGFGERKNWKDRAKNWKSS